MSRVLTVIEYPYAADTPAGVAYHEAYLQACIRDSVLNHNEAPFASHQMYTRALDDSDPHERRKGIIVGLAFAEACSRSVFYVDLGMSRGMRDYGLPAAEKAQREVVYRRLGGAWSAGGCDALATEPKK